MKRWLVVIEMSDDGKNGMENQELPIYLLDSRHSVSRYLLGKTDLDSGIQMDFRIAEELIP